MNRDEYILSLYPEDDDLHRVHNSITKHGMPPISVSPVLGQLLTLLTKTSDVTTAVEIGTLAGYSAICIARGLKPGGRLYCLEQNPEFAEVSRMNLEAAGLLDRVEIIVGDAFCSLQKLAAKELHPELVFIDADKQNYLNYVETALTMCRTGAIIIADNVLLRDRVLDESNESPNPTAMRHFNKVFSKHSQLESVLLPIYDGFSIARVKE